MTTTIPTPQWAECSAALAAAERILLVTHLKPDGDAIGSMLALGSALKLLGKQPQMAVDEGVPSYLKFMPNADQISPSLKEGAWDVMVSLDASDEERSGKVGDYGRAHSGLVINLDHHPTNTLFGDLLLVVPQAVSASEIVQDWLEAWGIPLTPEIATPLLVGLVTDTLGFRTSNVVPRTLALAQTCMAAGASLADVVARTLNSKPYSTIELWKYALPTVALDDGLISACVTQEHLHQARLGEAMDGGLIGVLISVDEAVVAVVYKERDDEQVELSFRSKVGYDVASVALSLGGGGHRQASGATVRGTIAEVQARVIPLLREAIQQGRAAAGS